MDRLAWPAGNRIEFVRPASIGRRLVEQALHFAPSIRYTESDRPGARMWPGDGTRASRDRL
jgi:hypothetical protein